MKMDSVKENVNFRRAYHKGKSRATPLFIVYTRKNGMGKKRLGITVSKKVGTAVTRNRVRRIIRAAAGNCIDLFPANCDIVIVARSAIVKCKSTDVEKALRECFNAQ